MEGLSKCGQAACLGSHLPIFKIFSTRIAGVQKRAERRPVSGSRRHRPLYPLRTGSLVPESGREWPLPQSQGQGATTHFLTRLMVPEAGEGGS